MNTEIQILKAENQNLKLFNQDKKEYKGQVSQVQFQIEVLTSKFVFIQKNLAANSQKIEEEVRLQIKKYQPQADKMEIQQKIQTLQKLYFKPLIKRCYCCQKAQHLWRQCLQLKRVLEQHRKEFGTSKSLYCNYFGGIYRKKLVVVESNGVILKQNLDNQQQQNKQHQQDNDDLRIYLEKLEKNYKKMEEQFYKLIEEKEELSQFEIDSDEDIYS